MRQYLIPDVGRAWTFWSMWVATLAVAWGAMPVEWQTALLEAIGVGPARVPAVLGVMFMLARVLKQKDE